MATTNETWGSRLGIVLAMAGNAVGFGNFLRFPVQAVENGGGAFIIPYIVCLLLLGIPLMFVEWTIGRYGGQFGDHSTPFIMGRMGKGRAWRYFGVFGIFSTIAIASYYCYLESWTISYIYHSIIGTFNHMSQNELKQMFTEYHYLSTTHSGIPFENIIAFVFCLALNVWILSKGLKGGIEVVAKWGVPLLILFGIFLAIKGITIKEGVDGAVESGLAGLNFLWTPHYSSLLDPKVWLAAAGQIFFTLSVGMGCIQCYASYMSHDEDIALGSITTSFINEFVEIVLGGTILLSISVGFFGLDTVKSMVANEGGFGIAFQTMPFLFQKWGAVMALLCGVAFFGLLFLAGITSSMAMCTPAQSFLKDEFNVDKKKSAIIIGIIILIWGLPTVLFYNNGVFDEYDYWAGTVSLFFFAMVECILFSWAHGINNSWKEFNYAADIKIPTIYKFILKFVTPTLLIIIFISALIKPANDDWSSLSLKGWEVDKSSLIGKIMGKDAGPNKQWFADTLYSEVNGYYKNLYEVQGSLFMNISCTNDKGEEFGYIKQYEVKPGNKLVVTEGDFISVGAPIMKGKFVNNALYISLSRYYLIFLFILITVSVMVASRKRVKIFKQ